MLKELKYLLTMFPTYQKTLEATAGFCFAIKRLTPTLLTLMLSIKIW